MAKKNRKTKQKVVEKEVVSEVSKVLESLPEAGVTEAPKEKAVVIVKGDGSKVGVRYEGNLSLDEVVGMLGLALMDVHAKSFKAAVVPQEVISPINDEKLDTLVAAAAKLSQFADKMNAFNK